MIVAFDVDSVARKRIFPEAVETESRDAGGETLLQLPPEFVEYSYAIVWPFSVWTTAREAHWLRSGGATSSVARVPDAG